MENTANYEQLLISAAARFRELAMDISRLGGKYVDEYQANTIAHKADLAMHIILKELRF